MMRLKLLSSMLALALYSTAALAAHEAHYRLTRIVGDPHVFLSPAGLNSRGAVAGAQSLGNPRGFLWKDGVFTDIHDQVNPAAPYVEVAGINDRGQLDGIFVDPDLNVFRGFVLNPEGTLRIVTGPPGTEHAFINNLNNREQALGLAYDVDGNESRFLWDRGNVTVFERGFDPVDLNDGGSISGTASSADGPTFAAIWKDGTIMRVGPDASFGGSINELGEVTGVVREGDGVLGFVWENGQVTVLPVLRPDQINTRASDINDAGVIVGNTLVLQGEETANIATLWNSDHAVANLNDLIDPNDPLAPFVTLEFADLVNNRGEIVAAGHDQRDPNSLRTYFLSPVKQ